MENNLNLIKNFYKTIGLNEDINASNVSEKSSLLLLTIEKFPNLYFYKWELLTGIIPIAFSEEEMNIISNYINKFQFLKETVNGYVKYKPKDFVLKPPFELTPMDITGDYNFIAINLKNMIEDIIKEEKYVLQIFSILN